MLCEDSGYPGLPLRFVELRTRSRAGAPSGEAVWETCQGERSVMRLPARDAGAAVDGAQAGLRGPLCETWAFKRPLVKA